MPKHISETAAISEAGAPLPAMQAPGAGGAPLSLYVWYVVGLLAVTNAVNYIDRMALAVLAPTIKADLGLTDGQLGLLLGFAFSIFYAICGLPIARWADRGMRRDIIAIALTTWSAMTALSGAAHTFIQLLLTRIGVGAGEAGCLPPAQSIICDYVPLAKRPGVFALHTFGSSAGMALGMASAGWLAQYVGWRWSFVVLGAPGLALALVVRLTLREPIRGSQDPGPAAEASSVRESISVLWRRPTYRLLLATLVVNGFVQYGLNQWWPSFFARTYGVSLATTGLKLGVALGVGSALGLLVGGGLANRLAVRDIRLPLVLGAGGTLLSTPAAAASLFATSFNWAVLFIFLAAVGWTVSYGPVLAGAYSVTPPRIRAFGGALIIFATSVLGFGSGPFVVGILSDVLAERFGAAALQYSLLVPVSLLPIMVLTLLSAAKSLPGDLAAERAPRRTTP